MAMPMRWSLTSGPRTNFSHLYRRTSWVSSSVVSTDQPVKLLPPNIRNVKLENFDEQIKSLREELLLAQSQRLDLAKFKLGAIAVLGSVALGASGVTNGQGAIFVMALIPFAALYIDSLGDSKKIQFYAIGAFLRQHTAQTLLGEYEKFCEQNREVFFQNYAYRYSTALVSAGIVAIGILHLLSEYHIMVGLVEILSGIMGLLGAVGLARQTKSKLEKLESNSGK